MSREFWRELARPANVRLKDPGRNLRWLLSIQVDELIELRDWVRDRSWSSAWRIIMTRKRFLKTLLGVVAAPFAVPARLVGESIPKLHKPLSEWRRLLPEAAYAVLFEEATEPPRSSPLNQEKRPGTFICAACYLPLFDSATKYESRTGWPSFSAPIEGRLATKRDWKLIFPRTEYHCIRCGGHQGHLFKDGPPPTGQRWCNNGVALNFVPADGPMPALRT